MSLKTGHETCLLMLYFLFLHALAPPQWSGKNDSKVMGICRVIFCDCTDIANFQQAHFLTAMAAKIPWSVTPLT